MKNRLSATDIFFRIMPATAGGFLGTCIFLLAFALLQLPASGSIENDAFSNFSVLVIAFVGAISANLLASFFLAVANPEKFFNRKKILFETLLVTILLFFAIIPFSLIKSGASLGVVGLYFIFSAMISVLLAERSAKEVSVFEFAGVAFAGFVLMLVFWQLFNIGGSMMIVILLFALPVSWFLVSIFMALGEFLSGFLKVDN